jgi:hypothetical protein
MKCGHLKVTHTVETKTWMKINGWPSTSGPPIDQTGPATSDVLDINTCDGKVCPAGSMRLMFPDPPYEQTSSSTVTTTWIEFELETHTKTYYIQKTKTTEFYTLQNYTYYCLDPSIFKQVESALADEFGMEEIGAGGTNVEQSA